MRALQHRAAMVVIAFVVVACATPERRSRPLAADATTSTTPSIPAAASPSTSTTTTPSTTRLSGTSTTAIGATARGQTGHSGQPDPRLGQVGGAGQAIVVTAPGYGATSATLTAYERTAGGWRTVLGPWTARVGTRGIAPPGTKREGDGRTPSGVYGFDFMFGVAADPGVRFPYRPVTDRIVWDDDPASPLYNTWVDLDRQRAGSGPEPMYVRPAYDHGAVIAYNAERAPGLGSAIFLHVSTGAPTAGCVSLPAGQLVQILRWLDPGRSPRIVIAATG